MGDAETTVPRNWREEIDTAAAARCEAAIDTLGRLPVFDATIQRILGVLDDPDASNEQLVAAMESDATYAAKEAHLHSKNLPVVWVIGIYLMPCASLQLMGRSASGIKGTA